MNRYPTLKEAERTAKRRAVLRARLSYYKISLLLLLAKLRYDLLRFKHFIRRLAAKCAVSLLQKH
jgi:hypothetical protein